MKRTFAAISEEAAKLWSVTTNEKQFFDCVWSEATMIVFLGVVIFLLMIMNLTGGMILIFWPDHSYAAHLIGTRRLRPFMGVISLVLAYQYSIILNEVVHELLK